MKLITSFLDSKLKPIYEAAGQSSEKKLYIEGIFMQAETPNRNNRIYPKKTLKDAVDKYVTEQVNSGRACGELGHPDGPTVNLDRVSHRIISLKWDDNNVIGKALVLNTPMGQIVKGLVEGGVQLGVSSRGMGSVEEGRNGISIVQEDLLLNTVDVVQDPSAPSAFVNGIMEGREFFFDRNGSIVAEEAEKVRKKLRKMTTAQIIENQVAEFEKFMSTIRG